MSTIDNFRDPAFCDVWSRWHTARHAWENVSKQVSFKELPDGVGSPNPSLITNPFQRAVAQEFLVAREVYKRELEVRRGAE